ncbi:hypothetical protein Tco_1294722 [Tanacetum coccineum]
MLAPKCPTFNGRPTFANPMYLKKAQYEKPCLYGIPHDQSDPANKLAPDREEILTLEEESRSKLNKDLTSESGPVPSRLLLLQFLGMVVGNYRIVLEKNWYAPFVVEVGIVERAIGVRD